jgi:hypothetical protein
MTDWTPATKEEIALAIAAEREASDPLHFTGLENMLVELSPCKIHRFGAVEQVFIVARASQRVVYFDDVEDDFATAREVDGQLVDCAAYGPLILALEQAAVGR